MWKRIHFSAGAGEYVLKDAKQKFQKKPLITLVILNLTLGEASNS